MDIEGLTVKDNGVNNAISIDGGSVFTNSKIIVNGDNNVITLGRAEKYHQLTINFRGNNKTIEIKDSIKNINGFKFTSIRGDNQKLFVGSDFSCGGVEIQMNDGNEQCQIGNACLFSWGIKIRTSDGHSVVCTDTGRAINEPRDVLISDSVWVGEDVSFLKGSSISHDCVVGSRSVVTKAFFESNCVIAGFPAKVVKSDIKWDYRPPCLVNAD